ncbi:MAG TPA: Cof-type HAD-IIB family hydrolase [Candidatus Sulfotelmatobacter sp.]|nr:Cof-type HAD-IIB family hydrolase [Candidatus Sulfotelmatobacter sp.]
MNSQPIRLLALDIDGTLLDPQFKISAQNLSALRAAHAAGIEIVLATGRRHDYALPVAQEIGVPSWLISSNGALIRSSTGETFFADLLPAATAAKLIHHMEGFRGNAVLTFDRNGSNALILERFEELNQSISRWIAVNSSFIQYVSPLEDALVEDPIQAMYCGRMARMEEAQKRLAEAGFLGEISILKTQYDHRDLCILDILNQGCSKGHALRRWAEKHGIRREQVMAIGDNFNDLEMLEFAGVAVVMGNASQELKLSGWKVTASNAENGVAKALQEILGLAFSI